MTSSTEHASAATITRQETVLKEVITLHQSTVVLFTRASTPRNNEIVRCVKSLRGACWVLMTGTVATWTFHAPTFLYLFPCRTDGHVDTVQIAKGRPT